MTRVVRRWLALALIAQAVMVGAPPVRAVQPDEILSNPVLEQRARALSRELRCMVCQNQSIDDSDAPLARDLRLLVRERLTAGDSDTQVIDHLTDRYGPFVLLKPQWGWSTLLLWLTPAVVFVIGALAMATRFRRRRSIDDAMIDTPEPALSAAEEVRLTSLRAPHIGPVEGASQVSEKQKETVATYITKD